MSKKEVLFYILSFIFTRKITPASRLNYALLVLNTLHLYLYVQKYQSFALSSSRWRRRAWRQSTSTDSHSISAIVYHSIARAKRASEGLKRRQIRLERDTVSRYPGQYVNIPPTYIVSSKLPSLPSTSFSISFSLFLPLSSFFLVRCKEQDVPWVSRRRQAG